jgi:hypothetical protein
MSKWPVENPPPERAPRINLRGPPPDPLTFTGPLNVFIELEGTASAYVESATTKKDYDAIVGGPKPAPARAPPPPEPGIPISSGHRVDYDKGVVDPDIARRVR